MRMLGGAGLMAGLVAGMMLAGVGPARAEDVTLKVIAINDFHGFLESPGKSRATPDVPQVPVGGVEVLAGYVQHLKSENPLNVVVSAGDLTGASPLVSALFHDEGTIETMNRLGLEINAVGNHEFDKGKAELLRKQHGGCFPGGGDTCLGAKVGTPVPFEGARFKYLAANTIDTATGRTIFPGYEIKTYHGVKVAFLGLTLKDTPTIVIPSMVAGLRFEDEASTINGIVRKLKRQGVRSFVVLIHEGGYQKGGPRAADSNAVDINACEGGMNGFPIQPVVSQLDDAVGLVISAHTHAAYVCELPNKVGRKIPVTSASAFGRMVTDIDVTLDTKTKKMTAVKARNIVVDRTNTAIVPDAAIAGIAKAYAVLTAPIVNRAVGTVREDIKRALSPSGEGALGDLIADAQLEATSGPGKAGAVIAFMNEGGIRADLLFASRTPGVPDGTVTFGALYTAQPFSNDLVTMTLTGAQIKTMLEEQFKGCGLGGPADAAPPDSDRLVQVSEGFSYTWSKAAAPCAKVDAASMMLNGVPVDAAARYRVTVNSLLADGGVQLYVLQQGTDRVNGPGDVEAMMAYVAKHPDLRPIAPHRMFVTP